MLGVKDDEAGVVSSVTWKRTCCFLSSGLWTKRMQGTGVKMLQGKPPLSCVFRRWYNHVAAQTEPGERKWPKHHTIPPSAAARSRTLAKPGQAHTGYNLCFVFFPLNTAQNMRSRFFHFVCPAPPRDPPQVVRLFAKNSKAKKICFCFFFVFFLISCLLRRFYFVKKKKKKGKKEQKQKFFGGFHNCAAVD